MLAYITHTNREENAARAPSHSYTAQHESNGPQEFIFFSKLDGERYVCFVAHCYRGNSGRLTKGWGKGEGNRAERAKEGEGVLLEGSTDGTTLDRLGRAVVVHHAAFGLTLSGEEQAAEFGHLFRADADWRLADDPGDAFQQRGCGQRAVIGPVVQAAREQGCRVEACESGLLAFGLDGIKRIKNFLEAGIFSTNLQEYSDNSEAIRLAGSVTKTWVFGVPVHKMKLSRILGPGDGVFRAPDVRSSPVEMKLLEPVGP